MKFTKKEIMDAFLLFLDDALPVFDCKKIDIHKEKCDNIQNMLEDISPLGIVDMIDENEDVEDK